MLGPKLWEAWLLHAPLVVSEHPVDLHALDTQVMVLVFLSLFLLLMVVALTWRTDRHAEQLKKLQKRRLWDVDETLAAMDQETQRYLSHLMDR